jgi:DNA-binding GntR family transcriptional regulator
LRHHGTQAGSDEHSRLDRAIVLKLLEDRERWTRNELAGAVRVDRDVLDRALERLEADGLAVTEGEDVLASPCARRIDELDLIGI